jgi:hypothetical protein
MPYAKQQSHHHIGVTLQQLLDIPLTKLDLRTELFILHHLTFLNTIRSIYSIQQLLYCTTQLFKTQPDRSIQSSNYSTAPPNFLKHNQIGLFNPAIFYRTTQLFKTQSDRSIQSSNVSYCTTPYLQYHNHNQRG